MGGLKLKFWGGWMGRGGTREREEGCGETMALEDPNLLALPWALTRDAFPMGLIYWP